MLNLDVLIFDIDGVLIDVSESYRTAIRETVQFYLQEILGLEPFAGELVSREDVAAFKLAGGFNNDWDLTAAIVKYLVSLFDADLTYSAPADSHAAPLDVLRETGVRTRTSVGELYERKDIPAFTNAVRQKGGGLATVWEILGTKNDQLLLTSGDRFDTNLVKRIFEELYLGQELFEEEYGAAAQFVRGEGLIRRERRIMSLEALDTLATKVEMGVATGRPRKQADFALENAEIAMYFRSLVAHEDVLAAERTLGRESGLGKPHPFVLLEAVRRITSEKVRCAYIGDTLDDVRAANRAKAEMHFRSIGCLAPAEDKDTMRREFEQVEADLIVDQPDELVEWVG